MTCGITTLAFFQRRDRYGAGKYRTIPLPAVSVAAAWSYYPVCGTHVIELLERSPNREGGNWHRQPKPCPFFLTESIITITNVLQEK